jgi:hypothetical protein
LRLVECSLQDVIVQRDLQMTGGLLPIGGICIINARIVSAARSSGEVGRYDQT